MPIKPGVPLTTLPLVPGSSGPMVSAAPVERHRHRPCRSTIIGVTPAIAEGA